MIELCMHGRVCFDLAVGNCGADFSSMPSRLLRPFASMTSTDGRGKVWEDKVGLGW